MLLLLLFVVAAPAEAAEAIEAFCATEDADATKAEEEFDLLCCDNKALCGESG